MELIRPFECNGISQSSNISFFEKGHKYVIKTTRSELTADHIRALARNEVRNIQAQSFVSRAAAEIISSGAIGLGYKPYINVDNVRRIGMAYYETEHEKSLIEQYFSVARGNLEQLRAACDPVGSPMDTVRCLLDEVWPAGANLQTLFGRKMFVGLSRMVEPNTTFLAHHDIFADDAPGMSESESVISQFGANVYVQVPENGGELLMWHRNMSIAEFDELRAGEYGIHIDDLPPPDVVLKPGVGDLLIFDAHKLHAVASPKDKARLALSFFIAYRGDDQPLTYWS
ncbi:MAG: 2OG-Fe(II) oxygenase [bacterium]